MPPELSSLISRYPALLHPGTLLMAAAVLAALWTALRNVLRFRAPKIADPAILQRVAEKLGQFDFEEARHLCAAYPSLATDALRAGLARVTDELVLVDVREGAEAAGAAGLAQLAAAADRVALAAALPPMAALLASGAPLLAVGWKISAPWLTQTGEAGTGLLVVLALTWTGAGVLACVALLALHRALRSRLAVSAAELGRQLEDVLLQLEIAIRHAQEADAS